MPTRCETAVNDILPAARAMIAKGLVDVYHFTQTKAARCMGVSQPAVSQYLQNLRGSSRHPFASNRDFARSVNDITRGIAEGSITPEKIDHEMCRICRAVQG